MKLPRILLVLALAASSLAWGETLDLPARVARLSYVEGEVRLRSANEPAATTLPDRPLVARDRLVTGRGGLAELTLGTATIRLDERSELSIVDLDATTIRIELEAGAASVYLNELLEDENFEILTPNTAITLDGPGEYRADVSADRSTALTVRSGVATVATASGPVRVAAGQRVQLEGRDALASLMAPWPADDFDEWVLERELRLAEAAPTYTPYEGNAYQELDQYGEWYDEPSYGRVWMPSYAYGGYDPFRYGHWERMGYGWNWIGSMPWSAHTFHYGRWAYFGNMNRWGWVPSRRDHRRYVAHDPRPGHRPRHDDDERTTPDTRSDGQPRRLHPVGAPTFRPDAELAKPRGGTMVPTPNRNPAPRPQSAPAPRSAPPPQPSATPTVRPSRPVETRREAPSRPASSDIDREAGTRHTP